MTVINFFFNLDIYQWAVLFFSLVMIAKVWSHFLRKEKSVREFIAWHIVFGGFAILALMPAFSEFIARATGFKSGVNAIVFGCLTILFYLVFRLTSTVCNLEKKFTLLVRGLALEEEKRENNEK